MKDLIAVSGLPRAGSTLLMNLLAQNQQVHATATSGLHEIMYIAKGYFKTDEFKALPDPKTGETLFCDFMRAGLASANDNLTGRPIVADKCRSWIGSANLFFKLFPNGKMLVPVRDIRGVLSSLEKKYQAHPEFQNEATQDDTMALQTIEGRVNLWLQRPPLGIAIQRIHELVRVHRDKVHFVHAEDLASNPSVTMAQVWDFLELEQPEHDFNNVEQYTHEHEQGWPYGDHSIRSKVEPLVPDWHDTLGRQLSETINQKFNWINSL